MPKKNNYQIFIEEIYKWVDRLGLRDWDVQITNEPYEEDTNCVATTSGDGPQRMLEFNLNKSCKAPGSIELAAAHEAFEGLLWPTRELLRRYYSEDVTNENIHRIIAVWTNLIRTLYP